MSACCCQPEAVSPVKVTEASCVPVLDQIRPVWVPDSLEAFQKRMAVIWPGTVLWKDIPELVVHRGAVALVDDGRGLGGEQGLTGRGRQGRGGEVEAGDVGRGQADRGARRGEAVARLGGGDGVAARGQAAEAVEAGSIGRHRAADRPAEGDRGAGPAGARIRSAGLRRDDARDAVRGHRPRGSERPRVIRRQRIAR